MVAANLGQMEWKHHSGFSGARLAKHANVQLPLGAGPDWNGYLGAFQSYPRRISAWSGRGEMETGFVMVSVTKLWSPVKCLFKGSSLLFPGAKRLPKAVVLASQDGCRESHRCFCRSPQASKMPMQEITALFWFHNHKPKVGCKSFFPR